MIRWPRQMGGTEVNICPVRHMSDPCTIVHRMAWHGIAVLAFSGQVGGSK